MCEKKTEKMKSALLVVLLAAAATAAVVSNEVPDVVELSHVDEVADLDEIPGALVTYTDELKDAVELTDEVEEPAQTAVESRRNLNQGTLTAQDTLIFDHELELEGIPGVAMMRTILINARQPISVIRVNRVGPSQNAIPSITAGGIGNTFVLITIESARGRGFHYRFQVYVR
ncbi:hypothetical protein PYW08_009237 [Mythimna loreyi]|uniref:Uncharacterized protein n=1 Tax=Mythimna loreyi TaxID=667449 RepID=A0ACC2Q819_9NEOP|nr:hypothetical protein PYW08_009237 [Mythimna loreyi]